MTQHLNRPASIVLGTRCGRASRRTARHRNPRSGIAMLLVLFFAAVIAIMLYKQVPSVAFESQRDREQLLMDRGKQYQRAIQLYYRQFKKYPAKLEDLENTNDRRFLRRKFVDPFTGEANWRLIHVGPGGVLIDSVNQKNKNQNGSKSQNTFVTELTGLGGAPQDENGGVDLATRKRASDGRQLGFPQGGPGTGPDNQAQAQESQAQQQAQQQSEEDAAEAAAKAFNESVLAGMDPEDANAQEGVPVTNAQANGLGVGPNQNPFLPNTQSPNGQPLVGNPGQPGFGQPGYQQALQQGLQQMAGQNQQAYQPGQPAFSGQAVFNQPGGRRGYLPNQPGYWANPQANGPSVAGGSNGSNLNGSSGPYPGSAANGMDPTTGVSVGSNPGGNPYSPQGSQLPPVQPSNSFPNTNPYAASNPTFNPNANFSNSGYPQQNLNGQQYPGQPPAPFGQPSGALAGTNQAQQLIGQILTSPQGGAANSGFGGLQGAGSAGSGFGPGPGNSLNGPGGQAQQSGQPIGPQIAGVASKIERKGIKIIKDKQKYNEWEFIYDTSKDAGVAGQSQVASNQNFPQTNVNGANSTFGVSSGSSFGNSAGGSAFGGPGSAGSSFGSSSFGSAPFGNSTSTNNSLGSGPGQSAGSTGSGSGQKTGASSGGNVSDIEP